MQAAYYVRTLVEHVSIYTAGAHDVNPGGKKGAKGQKGAAASADDSGDDGAESLDDIAGIPEAKARFDKVLQV